MTSVIEAWLVERADREFLGDFKQILTLRTNQSPGTRSGGFRNEGVEEMVWLLLVLLGVVAGAVSGLVGIGGGIIIVPALVLLFGFSQKLAQGTTLALLVPPIGILAACLLYTSPSPRD